jgi:hypothetical protein
MFPVAPKVFDRIEFRGVGGQILDLEPAVQAAYEFRHQVAAVCRKPVPEDQQGTGEMLQQMGQELDDFFFTDGRPENLEVEVPQSHARNDGDGLPVEMVLQHWRLAARSPSTAAMRPLAQSALVDEDDRAAFCLGFFLMTGQRLVFHSWMAASLRSRARPVGRCGLQFN